MAAKGKYEPKDSRKVTGTASTADGRWTNRDGTPPLADGEHPEPPAFEFALEDSEVLVDFEPAPELEAMIERARLRRAASDEGQTRH